MTIPRPIVDADSICYAAACVTEDEEVANALHIVRNKMVQLQETYPGSPIVYLSGSERWRDERATIWPYKGNRKSPKPKHLEACRKYLVTQWNACIYQDEADDAVGRTATDTTGGDPVVIVSIDKDLDNIPGLHYNWKKREEYYITPNEATCNFYRQVICGDRADNIPGLSHTAPVTRARHELRKTRGVGIKTAERIIDSLMSTPSEGTSTIEEHLYCGTLRCYMESMLYLVEQGDPTVEGMPATHVLLAGYEFYIEIASLLWISTATMDKYTAPCIVDVDIGTGLVTKDEE